MPATELPRDPADLRVAVVGYGSIGRRHYENLGRLGVRYRLLLRSTMCRPGRFSDPPEAHSYTALSELLAARPHLAIIANPTACHVATALELLTQGVPVLVEKPLSHDLQAAQTLVEAASAGHVAAGMAYPLRYHPAYRAARECAQQQRLGRLLYAKAWFESYLPDWHPWEDYRSSYAARRDLGGGAAVTLDHELDFLNWCLGDAIDGQGWRTTVGLDIECDDLAMLLLRFPGGVTAQATLSICRRDRWRGFEFIGTEASLRYTEPPARLELLASGVPPRLLWDGASYQTNTMYLELLADALRSLCANQSLPIPLAAGLAALRAARWAEPRAGS
ncbi:MAG: Gfo/Idh/MocA family oxidoreductase [Pirellulales bacterium]|nr:Gfo/Idh/MocA family oxidoreductase [Pirellulales bacterium]